MAVNDATEERRNEGVVWNDNEYDKCLSTMLPLGEERRIAESIR